MQGIQTVRATTFAALLAVVFLSVVFVSPVIGQDGKQIYGNRCALCHGSDGDGKGVIMQTAPFGADFWKANDDAAISKAIVEGKGRCRPSRSPPRNEGRRGVHESDHEKVRPGAVP